MFRVSKSFPSIVNLFASAEPGPLKIKHEDVFHGEVCRLEKAVTAHRDLAAELENSKLLHDVLKEWVTHNSEEANCRELINVMTNFQLDTISEKLKGYCQRTKSESFNVFAEKEPFLEGKTAPTNLKEQRIILSRRTFICITILYFASLIILAASSTLMIHLICKSDSIKEIDNVFATSTFVPIIPAIHTSDPLIRKDIDIPICKPLRIYSQKDRPIQRVMPDWSKSALNFCNNDETLILLAEIDFLYWPSMPVILCPERVTGLEIYVDLTPQLLQKLCSIFCNLETIVFNGNDICHDESIIKDLSHLQISVKSIRHVKFENLNFCANIFRLVYQSIKLPNLISMSFRCVSFEQPDFTILESIVHENSKVSNILCLDSDLCSNFNLNVSSQVQIVTEKESCNAYR